MNGVEIKFFEVRDEMTCMPVMCVRFVPQRLPDQEYWLVSHAGFHVTPALYMTILSKNETHNSAYDWGNSRTRVSAFNCISETWDKLTSGDVVDVRVYLGESDTPAISDRIAEGASYGL